MDPTKNVTTEQSQFFDMVRNVAMLSVVLFHAVAAYSTVTPHWAVHDGPSITADIVREVFDVFMMPLFFFVAGYFTLPSLLRKGVWQFLRGKLKRLGIPWLLAILVVVPILRYLAPMKAEESQSRQPFWEYWITYMKSFGTFQIGLLTPERMSQMHFWFLSLLLGFFIAFAFLYGVKNRWLENATRSFRSEPARMRSIFKVLLAVGVLTSGAYFIVSLSMPDMSWVTIDLLLQFQPTHLVLYIATFALGILAYSRQWFVGDEFPRQLSVWIPVSLLLTLVFLMIGEGIFSRSPTSHQLSAVLLVFFSLVRSFLCLAMLVMFTALALRYWNRSSPYNRSLAANAYNIYLVHLVFVISFQNILMAWPGGPPMIKAGIVFLFALLISYGISRLIDRFPRAFVILLLGLFALISVATK